MEGTVTTYVQPITEPLQGLHTNFTNLASQHRDINKQLRNHADDLLSGSSFTFQGAGAQAFSGLVNYYVDTSEKHMQAFDGAADAVRTCHSTITTASGNADGAGLHPGLTNHVLSQVTHNDIIERGSEPIWSVVNDLIGKLGDLVHQETSFWGNVFTFHFGSALDDLVQAGKDIKQIASDATSLLQDIGRVLGSWAETVWSAIKTVGSFLGSVLWNVADFVLGISSIINDVKVLFDPHKSIWEKLLAAGDLVLNVGMDVSMVLGIGEGLKAGELLLKGGIDLGEKLAEDGGEKVVEELADKGIEDVEGEAGQNILRRVEDDGENEVEQEVQQEVAQDPQLQNLQTELEQIQGIQDWEKLNPDQRLGVLQEVNNKIAEAYGFSPNDVKALAMEEGDLGGFNPDTKDIEINSDLIANNNSTDALETIAHESRHAYQQHLVDTLARDPMSLSDSDRALAERWQGNLDNYISPDEDYEAYASQPVEADAEGWATDTFMGLLGDL